MFANYLYNKNNEKILCRMDGLNAQMLMDITVCRLLPGEKLIINDRRNETAILILSGQLQLCYSGKTTEIFRGSVFTDLPYCLHFCMNEIVEIEALEESEFIIQQTNNENIFEPVLYTPETVDVQIAGETQWDGAAHRTIVTVFDYENAPYSNMVIGEVFNKPGKWSSYPPHHHPQPEVYYYKFDKPQGFGAGFIGDEVYKIADGGASFISGGNSHQQVTAPCYTMYYTWMIRHLQGNPWQKTRIFDKEHEWMAI